MRIVTREKHARILSMYKDGFLLREIAEEVGLSVSSVSDWSKRALDEHRYLGESEEVAVREGVLTRFLKTSGMDSEQAETVMRQPDPMREIRGLILKHMVLPAWKREARDSRHEAANQ